MNSSIGIQTDKSHAAHAAQLNILQKYGPHAFKSKEAIQQGGGTLSEREWDAGLGGVITNSSFDLKLALWLLSMMSIGNGTANVLDSDRHERSISGVSYEFVSQRWLTQAELKQFV